MSTLKYLAILGKDLRDLVSENGKDFTKKGLAFQNLPHRFRRRAASRHRDPKNNQPAPGGSGGGGVKTNKRKRRAKKRKHRPPCGDEVLRLTTHTWHAKRFHMTKTQSNWTLPSKSHEKTVKSSHNAFQNGCFILDMSFWRHYKLENPDFDKFDFILDGVRVTKVKEYFDNDKVGADMEKQGWLYRGGGQFPHGCIGPVIMSKCGSSGVYDIWIQPGAKDELENLIQGSSVSPMSRLRLLGPRVSETVKASGIFENFDFKANEANGKMTRLSIVGSEDSANTKVLCSFYPKHPGCDLIVDQASVLNILVALTKNKGHVGAIQDQENLRPEMDCNVILDQPDTVNLIGNERKAFEQFLKKLPNPYQSDDHFVIRERKHLVSVKKSKFDFDSLDKSLTGGMLPIKAVIKGRGKHYKMPLVMIYQDEDKSFHILKSHLKPEEKAENLQPVGYFSTVCRSLKVGKQVGVGYLCIRLLQDNPKIPLDRDNFVPLEIKI